MDKKEGQFIDWLCGKDVKFPFLKDMPKVPSVIIHKTKAKLLRSVLKQVKKLNKKYDKNSKIT